MCRPYAEMNPMSHNPMSPIPYQSPKVWVTYGTTESGDDLGVIIWHHYPTDDEINRAYRETYASEYDSIGWVNWTRSTATERR